MTDAVWNIMTRTHGGTVSLLKNLTEDQARGAAQRLSRAARIDNPWSDSNIWNKLKPPARSCTSYSVSAGDIANVYCWGPNDATLEIWPKPADYDDRLAKARAEYEAGK